MKPAPLPSILRFRPIYKDYLWGGDRIPLRFHRVGAPGVCAESWEVSAHPDGDSRVAGGPLDGRALSSLVVEFGRDLLGARAPSPDRFPLLCKLIDARQSLSVQVHPSPADPAADPREYKNECWHVIESDPGAAIYAGLCGAATDRASLEGIAGSDPRALAGALRRHSPREGETLYIPAGLVHAIGAGSLIYEVQQNSNTTYRLYDWDRRGADGRPRQLHFAEALRSIDFSLPPPAFAAPTPIDGSSARLCLQTPYFRIVETADGFSRDLRGESFDILFVKRGAFSFTGMDGASAALSAGDSALVPASASYSLAPSAPASAVLVTSL